MAEPPPEHPSAEYLRAFAVGKLSGTERAKVESHVAVCTVCCNLMASVPPDSFVDLVYRSVREASALDPTACGNSAATPADLEQIPAALIGHPRYRVRHLLGRGGMGTVYQAEQNFLQRPVALKIINAALLDRPEAIERFHREVTAIARLVHPNIVTAYDADQAGDLHFLVMEYVKGVNLAELVERQGPLPVALACSYIRQAALGLEHAFAQGMVHRDLKPQNLMLTEQGIVKVLDFGLARMLGEAGTGAGLTKEQTALGTPDYLAPEQAEDASRADIRSDIYSLGCTLYFLLTGQPPFPTGTALGKALAHRERRPQPVTKFRTDLPSDLTVVLERLLAKAPQQRYQTPQQVAEALAPFQAGKELATGWPGPAIVVSQDGAAAASPGPRWLGRLKGRRRLVLLAFWLGLASLAGWLALSAMKSQDGLATATNSGPPPETSGRPQSTASTASPGEVRCFTGHTGAIYRIAVNADGTRLLSGGGDVTARLWDVASGTELQCFRGHDAIVWAVGFKPGGKQAWSGSSDGARRWELATGKELQHIASPVPQTSAVGFAPDGRHALFGGCDGSLRLWDLVMNQELTALVGHKDRINGLIFDTGGTRALSASGGPRGNLDSTVRLWDLVEGKQIACFTGHRGDVHQAALSPDGMQVLSVSDDGTVRLWEVATEKEIGCWEDPSGRGYCVAFAPDGQRALTAGRSGAVQLWDVKAGKIVKSFRGHKGPVRTVAFTPDGRYALSGSGDKIVREWRLPD